MTTSSLLLLVALALIPFSALFWARKKKRIMSSNEAIELAGTMWPIASLQKWPEFEALIKSQCKQRDRLPIEVIDKVVVLMFLGEGGSDFEPPYLTLLRHVSESSYEEYAQSVVKGLHSQGLLIPGLRRLGKEKATILLQVVSDEAKLAILKEAGLPLSEPNALSRFEPLDLSRVSLGMYLAALGY